MQYLCCIFVQLAFSDHLSAALLYFLQFLIFFCIFAIFVLLFSLQILSVQSVTAPTRLLAIAGPKVLIASQPSNEPILKYFKNI